MLTGLSKKDNDSIEDNTWAEICARDLETSDDETSEVESIGTAWDDAFDARKENREFLACQC